MTPLSAPRCRAHDGNHLADLLRVQPGQHLVQQQQPRARGQRPRQLQALAAGHGQVGGRLVQLAGQAHPLGHGFSLGQRRGAAGDVQVRADGDVLAHRLQGEGLHDLEGARHAGACVQVRRMAGDVAAVEEHLAVVGPQEARDQREQRGLARAVGADQGGERAARHTEGHVLHRAQPAEGDRQLAHLEQRLSHDVPLATSCAPSGRCRRCRAA